MNPRRHTSSYISTVQIVAVIVVLLGVCVLLALMYSPRKPPAPPVSEIKYAERPDGRNLFRGPDDVIPNEAPRLRRRETMTRRGEEVEPVAETQAAATETPYRLLITVVDAASNEPLRGVRVEARRRQSDTEMRRIETAMQAARDAGDATMLEEARAEAALLNEDRSGTTDEDGTLTLSFAQAGNYAITCSLRGYMPAEEQAAIGGKDQNPDVAIRVRLSKGATVMGRVTESGTSVGAPDLRIRVERSGRSGPERLAQFQRDDTPITNANGEYVVSGLAPGEYSISVDVRRTPYKAGRVMPYQRVTITRPDQEIRGIDFQVDAAGVVWGYVTSPQRDPVQGADVVLCTSDSVFAQALSAVVRQAPPLTDSSKEDGYYELLGVPLNEEYRLYVTADNHSPQLADPFILTAANRSVRIDVFMFSGTSVYGVVVDDRRNPVENAEVICIPSYTKLLSPMESPQAFRNTRTDAGGNFVIQEVPAGSYQLFAQKRGYKIAAVGQPIYPNGYSDITGVVLALHPVDQGEHTVFGTVTDAAGAPLEGAQVSLEGMSTDAMDSISRQGRSDGAGRFRFDGIGLGIYRLEVRLDGYSPRTLSRVLLNRENRVVLEASSLVRGMVLVRETNRPPETEYRVAALPMLESAGTAFGLARMAGEPIQTTSMTADGSFELYVPAGPYRLEASAAGYTPGRLEILLEPGQVLDGIVLYLSREGGTIEGTVVTADGRSPQGTLVMVIEAGSESEAMLIGALGEAAARKATRVGADGLFSFSDLPAGSYVVVARHDTLAGGDSGVIMLEEQGVVRGIVIRIGTGGGLEGYVFRNGRPVAGAMILVMGSGTTKTATTERNGYYIVEGLGAGTYQVMMTYASSASLSGVYDAQGIQVEIEENRMTRYNFGEGTGVRIAGRCSPGPNSPLGGRAVLRQPGLALAALGQMVDITQLTGQSTGIDPMGNFMIEDVPPGDWQVDIYYFEFGIRDMLSVRYVHTDIVTVTGEEDTIPLDCAIQF